MLVYSTMVDQTIEPVLYRTGGADRSLAFALAGVLLASLPLLGWLSGPFLWPWGWGAMIPVGVGAFFASSWGWQSTGSVLWVPKHSSLEFRSGRKIRIVALEALTHVKVCPSEVVTRLEEGDQEFRLSHRLVGAEDLLDHLRRERPDLFPAPGLQAKFRVSAVGAMTTMFLALLTLVAALVLGVWQPFVGWIFLAGALLVAGRVLFFMPRAFIVGPGFLVQEFWGRRKKWSSPTGHREQVYAAGGAVFFRMRFDFGTRKVVLDEGFLIDPLKPAAAWMVEQLRVAEQN